MTESELIERAQPDIIAGDDGFFVYWPVGKNGALNAWAMRTIADELDRRNEPWAAQVADALSSQGGVA